jgi:streptogramin lyase
MKGIAVDRNGIVWFGSFSDHKLGRIDPKTDQVKLFQPPIAHAGLYGILVDRYNEDIWASDHEGSHITRFNPKTASSPNTHCRETTGCLDLWGKTQKAESGTPPGEASSVYWIRVI